MQNEPLSSAEVLRRQFARQKLQIDDINGDHLIDVYANCTEMRDRPNFYRLERFEQQDPSNLAPIDNDGHSAIGVILETRDTPALTYVIRNAAQVTGIPICLFHSKANSERLNDPELQDMLAQGLLTVRELPDKALLARGYNAILMSQKFWEIFTNFQKVLIFQTDAICCPQSPYKLTDFLNFDYIGARWKRERPFGLTIDGGVGGLSLRDVQLSIECLRRFSPQPWPNGEDGYFAFHMELIGGKVAKGEDCAKFCTQNAFTHQSFGGHQLVRLSISDHAKFMNYCPEAENILYSMPRALRRAAQDTP